MVTLKEARNVRFADFVQPGRVLLVTAEILQSGPREVQLKTQGTMAGRVAVGGRLTLERYNLADTRPNMAATDAYLRQYLKTRSVARFISQAPTLEDDGASLCRSFQGLARARLDRCAYKAKQHW